jgi:hypothetical protein
MKKGRIHVQVAGNMLPSTQCYFACRDIGTEKTSLFMVKPRYKAAVILKTCGLFIDEELDYINKSLCEHILKIVTPCLRFWITFFNKFITINNIEFYSM